MVSSTYMIISQEKIAEYKEKLEAEKALLEKEIMTLGHTIDDNGNWMATAVEQPGSMGNDDPDKNVQADYNEEMGENQATSDVLKQRHISVAAALVRIEDGSYGTCSVNGVAIGEDRLDANPAASTCKEHME